MHSNTYLIIAADAGKAVFYATTDRGSTISMLGEPLLAPSNPPSRDHKSDRPGRTHESAGPGRSAMEPRSDPHEKAETDFAKEVAEHLNDRVQYGNWNGVVVFAAPSFLGDLRKNFSHFVSSLITSEVDKDIAHAPQTEVQAQTRKVLFPD